MTDNEDLEKLALKFITLYDELYTCTGGKRKHNQINEYNIEAIFFNKILFRCWARDIILIIYQLILDNFRFLRSEFEGHKEETDKEISMEDIKKLLKLKNWCKWNDNNITGNTSKLSICEILYQNLDLYSSVLKFDKENKYLKVFITESYRRSRLCPFCYNNKKFVGKCTNNHGIHISDNQVYYDDAIFFSDEKISFDPKIAKNNCTIPIEKDMFEINKDRYTVFKGFIPVVCLLNEETVEIKEEFLETKNTPKSPKSLKIRCSSPPATRRLSIDIPSLIIESDEDEYILRFEILKNGLENIDKYKYNDKTSSLKDWDLIPRLSQTPNSFSTALKKISRVTSY